MPFIEVDETTYQQLAAASALSHVPVADIVRNLVVVATLQHSATPGSGRTSDVDLDFPRHGPAEPDVVEHDPDELQMPDEDSDREWSPRPPDVGDARWLPVHKTFLGHRVLGLFNPDSLELRLVSEPWNDQRYTSPTAAAVAVVENWPTGRRSSATNGRKFWRLDSSGKDLRSVIGQR